MTRLLTLVAFLLSVDAAGAQSDQRRPDVILVMTDDQGYGDFGFMGNPVVRTPHLDALARQSARWERFYVSPVCTPTRACLMTGRYNYRTGAVDTYVGRALMAPREVTVAEILRDAGYATGIFGKWHLGDNAPMRPQDQGFEEALVHRGGGIGQPSDPVGGEGRYTNPVLFHNGKRVETEGYCTDLYFDAARAFMDRSRAAGRPFFCYIATNAPHGPFHDVPEDLYREYLGADLDALTRPGRARPPAQARDRLARILAMITNVDDNMGRLLAELREKERERETLVLFLVDNGPNSDRWNGGLRGRKSDVYEGGIRSPLLARWIGRIEPGPRSGALGAHIDILPTVLAATGTPAPAGLALDGRSLWPHLTGRVTMDWERNLFIQTHRGDAPTARHHCAVVSRRWKLVRPTGFGREKAPAGAPWELYDLARDPGERQDVAAPHPRRVSRMAQEYDAWFRDVTASAPATPLPIHLGSPTENPVVLTRQDWRHLKGRPWGGGSNGYWQLDVVKAGSYDVVLRLREPVEGQVELQIGGQVRVGGVNRRRREARFPGVTLPVGPTRLLGTVLVRGQRRGGPLQVVLSR